MQFVLKSGARRFGGDCLSAFVRSISNSKVGFLTDLLIMLPLMLPSSADCGSGK